MSPLVYPEALSRNEQGLARMYLRGIDPELQQALLDELAGKLRPQAKTVRPVRNLIGILAWMRQEAKAGRRSPVRICTAKSAANGSGVCMHT